MILTLQKAWLFQDKDFWKPAQIKALLNGVPKGTMLILDLYSEVNPLFNQTESFYGQPFIWCMLGSCFMISSQKWRQRSRRKTLKGNFGGDTGWYGVIPDINDSLEAAQKYPNSTLLGTAIVPEGLFQNEFVYDYTLQLGKMAL